MEISITMQQVTRPHNLKTKINQLNQLKKLNWLVKGNPSCNDRGKMIGDSNQNVNSFLLLFHIDKKFKSNKGG